MYILCDKPGSVLKNIKIVLEDGDSEARVIRVESTNGELRGVEIVREGHPRPLFTIGE